MKIGTIRVSALFLFGGILAGPAPQTVRAQDPQPIVFHVRHVEDTSVYIDLGRNVDLHEGTILSLYHAASAPGTKGAAAPVATPFAKLKVLIVADSSSVCDILNSPEAILIGDVGYFTPEVKSQRTGPGGPVPSADHPIFMAFTNGDPRDDEIEPVSTPAPPDTMSQRHAGIRIGLDYDGTEVQGGFHANEYGFQIDSDMNKIGGTNWSFTGYWRSRWRDTDSGLNGEQLETLDDRIDRTYHVGLYYNSQKSPFIAGFGRLSVPGAPSLPTVDGGYFGVKLNPHVTMGVFGGTTPDPSSWDYNPDGRIAGTFTNLDYGDFEGLHFSGAEGLAATTYLWRIAREFVFFENTLSWKRYLWFYNSTQVDAARTSPVPGAGSNPTGISFTSSSIRIQPLDRLNLGINHSYSSSLPTFDPNLLGTTLLDKYIFQGLSVDAHYDLPWTFSLFTQVGRSHSIADTKQMWNQMYGFSVGNILHSGFRADVRYSKFDSSIGLGNYRTISISRSLANNFQFEFIGGSQSLVSTETSNTSSRFATGSVMWNLGPRYFFETGYTYSEGTTMNYKQWNSMFGYRFGTFRGK